MRRTFNAKSTVRGESTIRDAYGFEVSPNLVGLYTEHSATWSAEEKFRTDKWLQFLKDICPPDHQKKNVIYAGFWDAVLEENLKRVIVEHKSTEEGTDLGERLDSLVRMGVPSFLRGYAWGLFLCHDAEKTPGLFDMLSNQARDLRTANDDARQADDGYSHRMLLRTFSSGSSRELEVLDETTVFEEMHQCDQTVEQIGKDLDRTFPGHPLMDENGKDALREILVSFSLHRPDIGYCQGMNFISGLLLLFHQPEDAFWNLSSIIEHLLPNQFDRDMVPAVVDKLVFSHLLQHHFPQLAQHLDDLTVDASYVCPHWFLCCFVNALPMETCLRVWDILFWERTPAVLFKVALALIDFYSQDLMKMQNAAAAWEQLQMMAASSFDGSRLIETISEKFCDVDEQRIKELRAMYLDRTKEQSIKDLLGKDTRLGVEDGSTATTPTKILAASASLNRIGSTFSSSSNSTVATSASHDSISSLRNDDNRRVVRDAVNLLQDISSEVPEELAAKVDDLIDRLIDTESESRGLRARLDYTRREVNKANDVNRSLKNRLGAVYTELDKKNEYLDRMIAKCQILTEKVATQEEIICQQKRLLFNKQLSPAKSVELPGGTRTPIVKHRSTQSLGLKSLFSFGQ